MEDVAAHDRQTKQTEPQVMQVDRIELPARADGQRDEAAWLEMRKRDYTASDVGKLWGVGLRGTELGVYLAKAGAKMDKPSQYTERGHVLEPVVAQRLLRRWPGASITATTVYLRGRDPDDPAMRIGATKDYDLVRGDQLDVLEIKTIAEFWFRRHWLRGGKVVPPDEVVWQVRTQAMLEGCAGGVIAAQVINAREDLHLFYVPRVPELEIQIQQRVAAFWRRFEAGLLPPLRYGHEAKALDAMRREAAASPPMLGDNRLAELATAHATRTRAVAEAEAELKKIEDEIRVLMGTNAVVMLPDARRITANKSGRRRVRIQPR